MNTITIPRSEYLKIVKSQEKLSEKVDKLQRTLEVVMQDEFKPEYAKKLDRISASFDRGKGVRFLDSKNAKRYLRSM